MNLCYDIFGTYSYALYVVGVIMLFMLLLMQYVVSSAHSERKRIEAVIESEETVAII